MAQKKRFNIMFMAMVGVMSALVFVSNWLQIPIPTPIDSTRLHMGTIMCLLSGLMLGPLAGGLASGFGCMFYDFTNPIFVNEAWITFITKFLMAWLCGKIAWSGGKRAGDTKRNLAAAVAGAMFYVVLYLIKNFITYYFFLRMKLEPVLISLAEKGLVSVINGIIGVIAVIPLHRAVHGALRRTGFYARVMGAGQEREGENR